MHSALFVAQKPEPFDAQAKASWLVLVRELRAIALSNRGIEEIAENVMLLPLPSCSVQLLEAIRAAASMPTLSRTLYFAEPPQWANSSDGS